MTDICFQENSIFAVGDSNKGVAVCFDETSKFLRGKNAPEQPHGRYRNMQLDGLTERSIRDSGSKSMSSRGNSLRLVPPSYADLFSDYSI